MQRSSKSRSNSVEQQGKRLPFIALLAVTPLQNKEQSQAPPSNIYTHCNELPLSIFIECVLTQDLTLLYKDTPREVTDELREIWDGIYSEYASRTVGAEFTRLLELQLQLSEIELLTSSVSVSLDLIKKYKSPELIASLNEIGYIIDPEDVDKSIAKIKSQLKGLVVKHQILIKELEDDTKDKPKSEPTREYFDDLIALIEKHMGFHFPETITVSKFLSYLSRFQKDNKVTTR